MPEQYMCVVPPARKEWELNWRVSSPIEVAAVRIAVDTSSPEIVGRHGICTGGREIAR